MFRIVATTVDERKRACSEMHVVGRSHRAYVHCRTFFTTLVLNRVNLILPPSQKTGRIVFGTKISAGLKRRFVSLGAPKQD